METNVKIDGSILIGGRDVKRAETFRAIDPATGEPTLIQNAPTQGFHPRTFSIDPSGRLLVVGNQDSLHVRDGNSVRTVLPGLTVFRVQDDGKLAFVSKSDVDTKGKLLYWVMFVKLR